MFLHLHHQKVARVFMRIMRGIAPLQKGEIVFSCLRRTIHKRNSDSSHISPSVTVPSMSAAEPVFNEKILHARACISQQQT